MREVISGLSPHPEMQLLTRNITLNLVRHASKASSIPAQKWPRKLSVAADRPNVASNQLLVRNYASKTNPQNLPKFPVQPLKETLDKFLKTAEPHLNECELQETCRETENFLKGDGAKLQELLEYEAKISENWLAERWLKSGYLQYRDPVTVFSSPGMTLPPQQFASDTEWLQYTAKVIFIVLKYKEMADNKKIPIEKMGDKELDMSQYEKVFGTCRIPGLTEDSLQYNRITDHVAVVYKGKWFSLPVMASCGILHPDLIFKQLEKIVCKVGRDEEYPVGILTTNQRDQWAIAYCDLLAIPGNKESIRKIQTSLFTVALDVKGCCTHGENEKVVVTRQLIHGGGSTENSGNRWMDKTIQIVVNRNGVSGFCYEHSPAEGQPIAIMTDFIYTNLKNKCLTEGATMKVFKEMCELKFSVNEKIVAHIEKANEHVDKLAKELMVCVLHYKGYGKEFIKTQKVSPDSYIQMAMQYAFYRMHKVPAAVYESAHLRMFPGGRTETIRSCSNESVAFVKSMVQDCPDDVRVRLLKEAAKAHHDYTVMALQGKGVDRHLLGLKLMAIENKLPIPKFFSCPGIVKSAHFRISSSQVASKYESWMCYGTLTEDGYGCCYNPRANDMYFSLSNWLNNKETDCEKFGTTLRESLDTMHELLTHAGEKPKAKM